MLKVIPWVIAVCVLTTASGKAATPILRSRAVFKLSPDRLAQLFHSFLSPEHSSPMKKASFGLRTDQIKNLRELTRGAVDFEDIYFMDHLGPLKRGIQGYQGEIYPNVPPPGIIADPVLNDQSWFKQLHLPEAWDLASGRGVTVADCDSGFYIHEADISGNLLLNEKYDLSDQNHPDQVDDGAFVKHGTSVASVLAGVRDGKFMSGVAYDSKMIPLQNFNYDPKLDGLEKEEATARCILRAIKLPDVRIIMLENQMAKNSSEGFIGTREAVKLALMAGITIVSAGGNNHSELLEEQNNDTGSIIVGALSLDNVPEYYTNYSNSGRVCIAAYGSGVNALVGPNNTMGAFGGTSSATPQVAGTVALMLEVNPRLTPDQIKQILIATRVQTAANAKVGGLLNSYEAVTKAKQTPPRPDEWMRRMHFRDKVRQILFR